MNRTGSIGAVGVAALVVSATTGLAQGGPTAAQLVDRIAQHSGVKLPTVTVDTFKSGDPDTPVRGIAVTMMATLDVLKRAAANGDNFVITHEPTFYSHRDTLGVLEAENDAVLAAKKKFIADHGGPTARCCMSGCFNDDDSYRPRLSGSLLLPY